MAAVQLDAGEKAVLDALDAALDNLFTNGAEQPPGTVVLAALEGYAALANFNGKDIRPSVRDVFKQLFAAVMALPPAWIAAPLQSGWAYYGSTYNTPAYHKNALGDVVLKGLVSSDGSTNLIFVLPPGYRPAARYLTVTIANSTLARVDVDVDGSVTFNLPGGVTPWVSLDSVRFRAAVAIL